MEPDMPISMRADDGSIQTFPDETSPDAIQLALMAAATPGARPDGGQQQSAALVCPPGTHLETRNMLTTGYDNSYQSSGKNPGDPGYGQTASGAQAQSGTIAAPSGYPFGTQMFIPGYGAGTVQDRGGAIKGDHIDLWFPSRDAALQWVSSIKMCKPA